MIDLGFSIPDIDWVILRAWAGDRPDKKFAANVTNANERGMLYMPGARPEPEKGDPFGQADQFMELVQDTLHGKLPPMVPSLDFDGDKLPAEWQEPIDDLAYFYAYFINRIIDKWGILPSIYTLENHWNRNVHPVAIRNGLDFTYGGNMVWRQADYRDDQSKYPPVEQDSKLWGKHLASLEPASERVPDQLLSIEDWHFWQWTSQLAGKPFLGPQTTGPVTGNVAQPWVRKKLLVPTT